jgi:hypothetical protein
LAALLPAFAATLPFLLLIMATLRLPLTNPSPVFGLALLLVVLLLGVTKLFSLEWMPAIGLACVTALECAWHFNRFDPGQRHPAADLVFDFLRRVRALPVPVPSATKCKGRTVGRRRAGRPAAILSLSTASSLRRIRMKSWVCCPRRSQFPLC